MSFGPEPKGLGPQDHDDDGDGDHGGGYHQKHGWGPEPEGPEPRGHLEEGVMMKVVMVVAHGDEDNGRGYDDE